MDDIHYVLEYPCECRCTHGDREGPDEGAKGLKPGGCPARMSNEELYFTAVFLHLFLNMITVINTRGSIQPNKHPKSCRNKCPDVAPLCWCNA